MRTELDIVGLDEALLRAAHDGARLALAEQDEPSPWLSVASAAQYLDTSQDAIRALIRRNQIPHHRTPEGRILFDRRELDDYARAGDLAA
jgi:excisionase family DNA binding protein